MPDTSTPPMNHDYDASSATLTPKPDARPVDNSGNAIKPSKFKLPQTDSPKHVDPTDGKSKSINDIIDAMG